MATFGHQFWGCIITITDSKELSSLIRIYIMKSFAHYLYSDSTLHSRLATSCYVLEMYCTLLLFYGEKVMLILWITL